MGGDINPNWREDIGASIEPHRAWVRERLLPRLRAFREACPAIPVLLDLGNDDTTAAKDLLPGLEPRLVTGILKVLSNHLQKGIQGGRQPLVLVPDHKDSCLTLNMIRGDTPCNSVMLCLFAQPKKRNKIIVAVQPCLWHLPSIEIFQPVLRHGALRVEYFHN